MDAQLKKYCVSVLEEGRSRLGLMLGIVSRVVGNTYEVVAVSSDTGIPHAGDQYPLDAVYCREVIQTMATVTITEIDGVKGMSLHPLYGLIPCEAYISSPINIHGKVWGTLNYTSLDKRMTPFSAEDIAFNEDRAARISSAIAVARL